MDYDYSFLAANSAKRFAEIEKQTDSIREAAEAHRQKLEAGAEAVVMQNELLEKQVKLLEQQNGQLTDNYNKLKEMYDSQVADAVEAQKELKKSKRFNAWMMVIAIISMLATIAGPIISFLE